MCHKNQKNFEHKNQDRLFTGFTWKDLLKRRLPVTQWLPKYTLALFLQDMLAGFTVGIAEIPQGIAFAGIAGLMPQYGLYSGFMGSFVYVFLGSCKDVTIGPTSILALMIQPHVEKLGEDMAVLITFLAGCIVLMLGILHLGFVVEFFSYPLTAGFTSAAALTIASTQLKSLLGISGQADGFLQAVIAIFKNLKTIRKWDALLGVSSVAVLVFMREVRKYGSLHHRPEWSARRNVIGKVVFLLSLASNALVVIFGTVMAYVFMIYGYEPFKLTGSIGEGIPPFAAPPFSTTYENKTYTFTDMAEQYGTSIAFIPLVAILEAVAIAKAFAKGRTLDATQELLALGTSNIMGSFVRSMPVTGSFTRTAVNNASGVQTPLGGLMTGLVVLTALQFLTKTFSYIPKATLASVVVAAMFYLFHYEANIVLWKTNKIELIPYYCTLLTCVFLGLEYGILIGLGVNILFVLYPVARPPVVVERRKYTQGDVYLVTPSRSLQYPAAEFVREKIMKECSEVDTLVVVDGRYVRSVDVTVVKNLKVLVEDIIIRGQNIALLNFKDTTVQKCCSLDHNMMKYFRDGDAEEILVESTKEIPLEGLRTDVQQ